MEEDDLVLEDNVSIFTDKEYSIKVNSNGPIRAELEMFPHVEKYPILFMLRTGDSFESWLIPSVKTSFQSRYSSTILSPTNSSKFLK